MLTQLTHHRAYCIPCIHKLLALLFCLIIGFILLRFALCQSASALKQHKRHRTESNKHTSRELSRSIIICSIMAIVFYCISLSSLLIADVFIDDVHWTGLPYAITSVTWASANSFVYLTFMKRMHNVFKNTAYASSRQTYIFLFALIFIYFNWYVQYFFSIFYIFQLDI